MKVIAFSLITKEKLDITEKVVSTISISDEIFKPKVCTLKIVERPPHDQTFIDISWGIIVLRNDSEIFRGLILKTKRDHKSLEIQASDNMFYLYNNDITGNLKGLTINEVFQRLMKEYQINHKDLTKSVKYKSSLKADNKKLIDVLIYFSRELYNSTGVRIIVKDTSGVIQLINRKDKILSVVIDDEITSTYSYEYDRSNTISKVVVKNKEKKVVRQKDQFFGLVTKIVSSSEKLPKMTEQANQLIKENSKIKEQFNLTILGVDGLESGLILVCKFPLIGIDKAFMIESVTHNISGVYTQTLKVRNYNEFIGGGQQ